MSGCSDPAATPEAAVAAFVASYEVREPPQSAWHRRPGPGEVPTNSAWYDNTTRVHGRQGYGYRSRSVVRGPQGWAVHGGCV